MSRKKGKRRMSRAESREAERRANLAKYATWQDVLAESARWRRCAGCGAWHKVEESPLGKVCRKCGEPLSRTVKT